MALRAHRGGVAFQALHQYREVPQVEPNRSTEVHGRERPVPDEALNRPRMDVEEPRSFDRREQWPRLTVAITSVSLSLVASSRVLAPASTLGDRRVRRLGWLEERELTGDRLHRTA